jgi:glycosyltransferase involved in cell wall biosynthesis
MADTPTVSVILPTYNRARLLLRSLGSVLAQTYSDLEVIVVDDGSDDDTAALVKDSGDARVRYVRLEMRSGAAWARNVGIGHARSRYLAFQDSDDEWLPTKLDRQMRAFESQPDIALVYSDMYRVLADGRMFYHRSPTIVRGCLINPETRYWQTYMLGTQCVVIKRECLEQVGLFDQTLPSFEDLDLFLRLAEHYDFAHVHEPLVKYHENAGLSTDRRAELGARRRLVRKYLSILLCTDPRFVIKETMDTLLKGSLLPIVERHFQPVSER